MRSATPKVLHPLCGRPLIAWPVQAARDAGAGRVIVVDNPKRRLNDHLPEGVEVAIQEEPKGTGDAVAAAASLLDPTATVVVINGDVALLTAEALKALVEAHERSGAAATMATMELDEPGTYGRVIRDARRLGPASGRGQDGRRRDARGARRSARSTPACTRSTAARWSPRCSCSTPTTRRASCTCPTCCPPCARPGARWPRTTSATPTSRTASTTGSTSRTPSRSPSAASDEHMRVRRHDRRPRQHEDRRRR